MTDTPVLVISMAALLAACGGADDGAATLAIHISGEQAALTGYPAKTGDGVIAFEDGWSMEVHKVIVSLAGFDLRTSDGDDARLDAEPVVADLHLGQPQLWRFEDVPAKRWDRVGYRYQPPTAASRNTDGVDPDDVARMSEQGYSFLLEATAHKDDRAVELSFGFAFSLQLSKCQNGQDMTDGLVVRANGENQAQITVHLDHLFFDSWAIDDPKLRFDAMAAMAPADGPLTLDDLAKQDLLSDLKDAQGEPLELAYDPGSAFMPVPNNLEEYVTDAATTTGHWNGEGHCEYARQ
jgi:hypothetical protein